VKIKSVPISFHWPSKGDKGENPLMARGRKKTSFKLCGAQGPYMSETMVPATTIGANHTSNPKAFTSSWDTCHSSGRR
jgi:hypothetical protein